jgi:pyruvate,water dikinase
MVQTYAEYLVKKMSKEYEQTQHLEGKKKIEARESFIKWLDELNKDSGAIAGGKGSNLGEMYNAGMPVPNAFVVTAQAFSYFINEAGLFERINNIISSIDVNDTKQLEEKAEIIRNLVKDAKMPKELKQDIIEAYDIISTPSSPAKSDEALSRISTTDNRVFVAVRSSATTEDLKTASFAGQQESFLNVRGDEEIIDTIKKCFASLFTARAIYYRKKQGFEKANAKLAAVVQKMINSDRSGVMFTINPSTNKDEIVIEAVFGLGEGIVSGAIEPDHYVIDKKTLNIKEKQIAIKKIEYIRNAEGENEIINLQGEKKSTQVLTEAEIKKLAEYGLKLQEHYQHPQDIEFALEKNEIFIVQTRAVTTSGKKYSQDEVKGKEILRGLNASPGISSGKVKMILDLKDLDKIKAGDILVTTMTNPDMVVSMQKAAAIITDEGGVTAHAAIVSRELGIPCVVGTRNATTTLKENQEVTVDGTHGIVYEGILKGIEQKADVKPVIDTKTKIKVIVDLPQAAERASKAETDGIGLLRLEGIIANAKKHPLEYLRENKVNEYSDLIYQGISQIVKYFSGKECWIRLSDIRTDEFSSLLGSPKKEENPMLGMHGVRASLKYPELLKAEIRAINKVKKNGFKVSIMIPQVILVEEFERVKEVIKQEKADIKLGVMIETPAAVNMIKELCEAGIAFASIGSNDLTQYTLAVDRGNEEVQDLYSETNPAVLKEIKKVLKTCAKYNVPSSLCGQAGSRPEIAKFLVQNGITSISVNADAAYEISKVVKEIEDSQRIVANNSKVVEEIEEEKSNFNITNQEELSRQLAKEIEEKTRNTEKKHGGDMKEMIHKIENPDDEIEVIDI